MSALAFWDDQVSPSQYERWLERIPLEIEFDSMIAVCSKQHFKSKKRHKQGVSACVAVGESTRAMLRYMFKRGLLPVT